MSKFVSPRAAIIVSLTFAIALTIGVLRTQAEQQTGSAPPEAKPFILPPPLPLGFLFVVTSTGDGANVGTGGVCDDGTGNCTLRAAIQAANNTSGTDDTIEFNIPTTDPGFNGGSWIIRLSSPLPDISTNITISGPGPDKLFVQRWTGGNYRIFNVTTAGTAAFSGLDIIDGLLDDDNGAGIQNFNNGTVNVTNCKFEGNSAFHRVVNNSFQSKFGGGIYNKGTGTVNVTGSTFNGNSASDGGGGI
jgi:CSLREA domain-containing protein